MSSSAFLLPKAGTSTGAVQRPASASPSAANAAPRGVPEPEPERRAYVRLPAVRDLTGLPTSTIYRYVKTRQFPQPHALGPRTVGWLQSDIEQWLATRQPRALR